MTPSRPSKPSSRPVRPRRHHWLWVIPLLLLAGVILLLLPPVKRKALTLIDRFRSERVVTKIETVERIVERRVEVPVPGSVADEEPEPEPLPDGPAPGSTRDVKALFGGLQLESKIEATEGNRAALEREKPASYAVEFNFRIKIPKPATALEDFTAANASLPSLIPSFKDLLGTAKVSGFYNFLYQQKQKFLRTNILRLDRVLTRHNFYDLESVLELEHATSKQKALLLQAEMDVVSDGSDGDRMESFDDYIFKSRHFQPTTSYAWTKVTTKVNPLVPRLEAELAETAEKLKKPGLGNNEKALLQSRAKDIPRVVADLKRRSFLIAQEDPFIVIPMSFRNYRQSRAFTPEIGDYAVVICGDKMLPAIVGDYGPAIKAGEASLRIAREIEAKAGPYNRPVSDLTVTYLIFPGSAIKPNAAPDYALWHRQCSELLTKLGGDASKLHQWEDRLKKAPPPAVTPDGTPATSTATPGVTAPAAGSAASGASPASASP